MSRAAPSARIDCCPARGLICCATDQDGSPDGEVTATARSPRADLAVFQAPIGHRQPTLEDLPPWLREKEKPDTEANPPQDSKVEKES